MDDLGLAMTVDLAQDSARMILVVDALDLLGNDVRRLIPTDANVAARTTVLGIALAMGIPVDALHRIRNTVLRIHALLITKRKR